MEIIETTIEELNGALQEIDTILSGKQNEIRNYKLAIVELQENILEHGSERKSISDKIEILTATNLVFKDLRTGIEIIPGVKFATKLLLDSAPAKLVQTSVLAIIEEIWDVTPTTILEMFAKSSYLYNMVRNKLIERGWRLQTVNL